jgi:hypothetical protein
MKNESVLLRQGSVVLSDFLTASAPSSVAAWLSALPGLKNSRSVGFWRL